MLIRSTDSDEIRAASAHTSAVIAAVQWIDPVDNTGCFSFTIVDTTVTDNLLERGVVERVEISAHVAELVEM